MINKTDVKFIADSVKQYARDLDFVDDLAVEALSDDYSFWSAVIHDRKLAWNTSKQIRRLRKAYGRERPGTLRYRGSAIYSRFCAWVDTYPNEDLHAKIWPAVKDRLDNLMTTN